MAPLDLLGGVILHSLWQGALIAILLWALLRAVPDQRSGLRYLLACGALLAHLAAPLLTALSPGAAGVRGLAPLAIGAAPAWLPVEWIVAFWLGGVSVLSLRLIGGGLLTARLRKRATRLAPAEVQRVLLRLMDRLDMRRPLPLCLSQAVDSPLVIGWLRPVILLPASAVSGLGIAQIEALLAHELAHIRRHDALVNAVQSAIEVLLFYHPATWWISQAIRREREHCCDDTAAALCGSGTYARALSGLEELRQPIPLYALAASDGSLLDRIRRLLGEPSEGEMRFHWIGIGFVAALLLLALAAPVASRADSGWRETGRVSLYAPESGSRWQRNVVIEDRRRGEIEFRVVVPPPSIERRLDALGLQFEHFAAESEWRLGQAERGFEGVARDFERLGERIGESFERIGESFERIGDDFERVFTRLERLFSF